MTNVQVQWFASLVPLPIIIDGPGKYITQRGESVTIESDDFPNNPNSFGWYGHYGDTPEIADRWHRSGRIYFNRPCDNDIVAKV